MKHRLDYKLKGFKPNTRRDTFATLKEILVEVLPDVGCDISIS